MFFSTTRTAGCRGASSVIPSADNSERSAPSTRSTTGRDKRSLSPSIHDTVGADNSAWSSGGVTTGGATNAAPSRARFRAARSARSSVACGVAS